MKLKLISRALLAVAVISFVMPVNGFARETRSKSNFARSAEKPLTQTTNSQEIIDPLFKPQAASDQGIIDPLFKAQTNEQGIIDPLFQPDAAKERSKEGGV